MEREFICTQGTVPDGLLSESDVPFEFSDHAGWEAAWANDSRRLLYEINSVVKAYDTVSRQWLGTLWPELSDGGWLVIGPTGHCRGSRGSLGMWYMSRSSTMAATSRFRLKSSRNVSVGRTIPRRQRSWLIRIRLRQS